MSNEIADRRNAPLEEIDPELFIWELYDNFGHFFLEQEGGIEKFAIGYCDAGRLQVRPRTGEIAIMCEMDDGEKLWFHILKDHLDLLIEARNWRLEHEHLAKKP